MTFISEKLRRQTRDRAKSHCEYCQLHEGYSYFPHEIDHIYAEKHGGETVLGNLCLACADCNRHKGSNLCSLDPETSDITALYHPRHAIWGEHFHISRDSGIIMTLTATGRATAKVLRFNRPELVADRIRLIKLGRYNEV